MWNEIVESRDLELIYIAVSQEVWVWQLLWQEILKVTFGLILLVSALLIFLFDILFFDILFDIFTLQK